MYAVPLRSQERALFLFQWAGVPLLRMGLGRLDPRVSYQTVPGLWAVESKKRVETKAEKTLPGGGDAGEQPLVSEVEVPAAIVRCGTGQPQPLMYRTMGNEAWALPSSLTASRKSTQAGSQVPFQRCGRSSSGMPDACPNSSFHSRPSQRLATIGDKQSWNESSEGTKRWWDDVVVEVARHKQPGTLENHKKKKAQRFPKGTYLFLFRWLLPARYGTIQRLAGWRAGGPQTPRPRRQNEKNEECSRQLRSRPPLRKVCKNAKPEKNGLSGNVDAEESPAYDGSVLQRWVTDSHTGRVGSSRAASPRWLVLRCAEAPQISLLGLQLGVMGEGGVPWAEGGGIIPTLMGWAWWWTWWLCQGPLEDSHHPGPSNGVGGSGRRGGRGSWGGSWGP
ncbi:hypothetical protein QBC42DRAFT_320340 [Cladorrhinum samala]|uniref:Uncharacterized protein n=1 Tax=Cladorrhinum samala TaxID=585594 RepID=A0AAV9HAP0_9PEZI|nr:hypothetical protein QBC42DRAFT_320340 [Cladorrhinum samala]